MIAEIVFFSPVHLLLWLANELHDLLYEGRKTGKYSRKTSSTREQPKKALRDISIFIRSTCDAPKPSYNLDVRAEYAAYFMR